MFSARPRDNLGNYGIPLPLHPINSSLRKDSRRLEDDQYELEKTLFQFRTNNYLMRVNMLDRNQQLSAAIGESRQAAAQPVVPHVPVPIKRCENSMAVNLATKGLFAACLDEKPAVEIAQKPRPVKMRKPPRYFTFSNEDIRRSRRKEQAIYDGYGAPHPVKIISKEELHLESMEQQIAESNKLMQQVKTLGLK